MKNLVVKFVWSIILITAALLAFAVLMMIFEL